MLTSHLLVSKDDQVVDTITKVVDDFGKIDVFIANAGMSKELNICFQDFPKILTPHRHGHIQANSRADSRGVSQANVCKQ